jgi:hypothetical protein
VHQGARREGEKIRNRRNKEEENTRVKVPDGEDFHANAKIQREYQKME